jgi:hypothetical protein
MAQRPDSRCLTERDLRGSRFRCLLATSQPRAEVATFLTSLTGGRATVAVQDAWAPNGLLDPEEARLGEHPRFVDDVKRKSLTAWWLVNRRGANTPNWDIVSTCAIGGERGLLLVEGKAHLGEFANYRCGASNSENLARIGDALKEASRGWNELESGFGLSASSHFQLSNRFAFAWKLAREKIPVVLVYLGFLDARDMESGGRRLISSDAQWRDWVVGQARETVPRSVWGRSYKFDGTPVTALITTAHVGIETRIAREGE